MFAEGLVWDRRKVKSELEADGTRTLPMDTEKEPTRIHVEGRPHPKFPKWELRDTKPKRVRQTRQTDIVCPVEYSPLSTVKFISI
jgi:hypothetical protein